MYRDCFQHLYGIDRRRIPPTPSDHLRLHRLERPEPIEDIGHGLNFYPDYAPFVERLAHFVGVDKDNLVVGQGIESLIRDLIMLSCDPGDWVAFTYPTCAMFDIYAQVFGARAAHIVTDPLKPLSSEWFCRSLNPGVRLVILPNPGQPVETLYSLDDLRVIATRCRHLGAVLAIDEAYYGFGAPTALPMIDDFDNVVVLRTFSKAFGAAGIRVGYAIGSPKAIKPLDAVRQSGEIAGPSLTAATVLMDHWDSHVVPAIKAVCEGRDWLRGVLQSNDWIARGYHANHILVDMGTQELASTVSGRLIDMGVHVRTNVPPLDRYLLVTCGPVAMMRKFYDAFSRATA